MNIPKADLDYIIRMRREFHEYPEIGFDNERTVAAIKRELTAMGIPWTTKYNEHSVVGTIGAGTGKYIGLRADMDALPIQEETGLPYASKIPGQMHACGHDCHAAVLLGIAKALKSVESELRCRVKLIFQPAEEIAPSGGRLMCEAGVVDDLDEVFTFHITSTLDPNTVLLNKGCMNASCHSFTIKIHGKSAHVSVPHLGIDALAVANRIFMSIQEMRAREISAFDPVVVGIGEFHAGTAANVICDYAEIGGTVRSHSQAVEDLTFRRINEIARNAAEEVGATAEIVWNEYMPPVFNTPELAQKIIDIATELYGPEAYHEKALAMGSEDFAYYVVNKPGARFNFGTHPKGTPVIPGHNGKMVVDESGLLCPAEIMLKYVLENQE